MTSKIAAIQMAFSHDTQANIERTSHWVEQAAQQGANVILPSEVFENVYCCTQQEEHWFEKAFEWAEKHPDANITGFVYVSNELDSLKAALAEEVDYA